MTDELQTKLCSITNAYMGDVRSCWQDYFIDRGILVDEMTPIEQLMAWAFLYQIRSPENLRDYGGEYLFVPDPVFQWDAFHGVHIHPQCPVGKYRADFLVDVRHRRGGRTLGVVECDGHDYHERTKEQAQHDKERDRYFQSEALVVLRYTGSEIWRDPLKCAADALKIFSDLAQKYAPTPGKS